MVNNGWSWRISDVVDRLRRTDSNSCWSCTIGHTITGRGLVARITGAAVGRSEVGAGATKAEARELVTELLAEVIKDGRKVLKAAPVTRVATSKATRVGSGVSVTTAAWVIVVVVGISTETATEASETAVAVVATAEGWELAETGRSVLETEGVLEGIPLLVSVAVVVIVSTAASHE